jgi:hypothetical protein
MNRQQSTSISGKDQPENRRGEGYFLLQHEGMGEGGRNPIAVVWASGASRVIPHQWGIAGRASGSGRLGALHRPSRHFLSESLGAAAGLSSGPGLWAVVWANPTTPEILPFTFAGQPSRFFGSIALSVVTRFARIAARRLPTAAADDKPRPVSARAAGRGAYTGPSLGFGWPGRGDSRVPCRCTRKRRARPRARKVQRLRDVNC